MMRCAILVLIVFLCLPLGCKKDTKNQERYDRLTAQDMSSHNIPSTILESNRISEEYSLQIQEAQKNNDKATEVRLRKELFEQVGGEGNRAFYARALAENGQLDEAARQLQKVYTNEPPENLVGSYGRDLYYWYLLGAREINDQSMIQQASELLAQEKILDKAGRRVSYSDVADFITIDEWSVLVYDEYLEPYQEEIDYEKQVRLLTLEILDDHPTSSHLNMIACMKTPVYRNGKVLKDNKFKYYFNLGFKYATQAEKDAWLADEGNLGYLAQRAERENNGG